MEPLREAQIGKPKLDLVFERARAHAMRDVLVEFTAASPPDYCPTMNILIKRVYEEPDADDGTRILVDRLWPRGLSKEKARVDLWLKDVAPSTNLRKWFAHDPAKWTEFQALPRGTQEGQGTNLPSKTGMRGRSRQMPSSTYEGIERYLRPIGLFSRSWCDGERASGVARLDTAMSKRLSVNCAIEMTSDYI
jgi:hypothetical protein